MYLRTLPHIFAISTVALLLSVGSSAAVTIVQDNFNDANITMNGSNPSGWTTSGYVTTINYGGDSSRDDVAAMRGSSNAGTASPDAWIQFTYSTLNYINLSIHFDWKGHDAETGDIMRVQWKPTSSGTWLNLGSALDLSEDYWHNNVTRNLPTSGPNDADNLASIDIRFLIEVNHESDWGKIDNFKLKGDLSPPPNTDVPIPGALPLFASGIGALGYLGWRRRRKQAQAV